MLSRIASRSIDEDVYTGFWINRSLTPFQAATLTLDRQTGGLLIVFLALFIATSARGVWKIVRFLLHVTYSGPAVHDGIHHQRQAILRNSALPLDAFLDFLRCSLAWRHIEARTYPRFMLATLIALLISIASVAAGILSSGLLTGSNNQVLLSGRGCGKLTVVRPTSAFYASKDLQYRGQRDANDFAYALQCFRGSPRSRGQNCDSFIKSSLPVRADRAAPCPFDPDFCMEDTKGFSLNSDWDSRHDLGLNKGPRFRLKRSTHCSPLAMDTSTLDLRTASSSNESIKIDRYGLKNGAPMYEGKFNDSDWLLRAPDYTITVVTTPSDFQNVTLAPGLQRENASVSILFLDASSVRYLNKTTDPWFRATKPQGRLSYNEGDFTEVYASDFAVGILGCVTQEAYCKASTSDAGGCVSLSVNTSDLPEALERVWPDVKDRSIMRGFLDTISRAYGNYLDHLYNYEHMRTLLARATLSLGVQSLALPSDHWMDEREHLYNVSSVLFRSALVDYARGYEFGGSLFSGANNEFTRLCHIQIIRSSLYYSFSAWSLAITFLLGSITMLLAFFIEEIFSLMLKHAPLRGNHRLAYALLEWQANSSLQLQRMAHENLKLGKWEKTNEAVPVTQEGDKLGVLDTTDPKHPRLVKPDSEMVVLERRGSESSSNINSVSDQRAGRTSAENNIADGGKPAASAQGVRSRTQYLRLPSNDSSATW